MSENLKKKKSGISGDEENDETGEEERGGNVQNSIAK